MVGSREAEYEEKKKVTYARMRRIGPVFRMEGREFASDETPLARQRQKVARAIVADLTNRWGAK